MRSLLPLVFAVALAAAGCFASTDESKQSSTAAEGRQSHEPAGVVYVPAKGPGRRCSTAEARAVVAHFIDAFNDGDLAALDRIFAPEGRFQWYSTDAPGERLGDASYHRSTLIEYFAERHQRRERLELGSWKFNGNRGGFGHFQFQLTRGAADLDGTPYDGKGAIDCRWRPRSIAVWAMSELAS